MYFLFSMPNIMHTTQYILLSTFSCLKFIIKVVFKEISVFHGFFCIINYSN